MENERPRRNDPRDVVETALKAVHADLISALGLERGDWRAGSEVRAGFRQHIGLNEKDESFLGVWLENIEEGEGDDKQKEWAKACRGFVDELKAGWRGSGRLLEVLNPGFADRRAGDQDYTAGFWIPDPSLRLFANLLGVGLMPLDQTSREFFYAGIYHPLLSRNQTDVIMDTVVVPWYSGSVGHAFKHPGKHGVRTVPNTIRELRGHVSIEDLAGGNLSLIVARLEGLIPRVAAVGGKIVAWPTQAMRDAFGMLFFFVPIPDFFPPATWSAPKAPGYASNVESLCSRIAKSHQAGLHAILRSIAKDTALARVTNLYASSLAETAQTTDESVVQAHRELLKDLLGHGGGYDPLGAAVGISMAKTGSDFFRPTGLAGSKRFLEVRMTATASSDKAFHERVNTIVEELQMAATKSQGRLAMLEQPPRLGVQWPNECAPDGELASSVTSLASYELIHLAGELPAPSAAYLFAHVNPLGGAVQRGPPRVATIPGMDVLLRPLTWLSDESVEQTRKLRAAIRELAGLPKLSGDPRECARFAAEVEGLKLLTDASESYLGILAEVLAGGREFAQSADALATYLTNLLRLLAARIAGRDDKPRAPVVSHDDLCDALQAQRARSDDVLAGLGEVVGISAFRVSTDRPICVKVTPDIPEAAGDPLDKDLRRHLRSLGEMDRLARLTLLLSFVSLEKGGTQALWFPEAEASDHFAALLLRGLGHEGDLATACVKKGDGGSLTATYRTDPNRGNSTYQLNVQRDGNERRLDLEWHLGGSLRLTRFAACVPTIQRRINAALDSDYRKAGRHRTTQTLEDVLQSIIATPKTPAEATIADLARGSEGNQVARQVRSVGTDVPREGFFFRSPYEVTEDAAAVGDAIGGFRRSLAGVKDASELAGRKRALRHKLDGLRSWSVIRCQEIGRKSWTRNGLSEDEELQQIVQCYRDVYPGQYDTLEALNVLIQRLVTVDNRAQILSRWFKASPFEWRTGANGTEFGIPITHGLSAFENITHFDGRETAQEKLDNATQARSEVSCILPILNNSATTFRDVERFIGDMIANPAGPQHISPAALTRMWRFSIGDVWKALAGTVDTEGGRRDWRRDQYLASELKSEDPFLNPASFRISRMPIYSEPLLERHYFTNMAETLQKRIPVALKRIMRSVGDRSESGPGFVGHLALENWQHLGTREPFSLPMPFLRVMFASQLKPDWTPFESQKAILEEIGGQHDIGIAYELLTGYGSWSVWRKAEGDGWEETGYFLPGAEPVGLDQAELDLIGEAPRNQVYLVRIGVPRWQYD